jgi:hypothetical protein
MTVAFSVIALLVGRRPLTTKGGADAEAATDGRGKRGGTGYRRPAAGPGKPTTTLLAQGGPTTRMGQCPLSGDKADIAVIAKMSR